jgi:hypothetical protein
MATQGEVVTTTIKVTEDLSAAGCIYHAIALNDSKLANGPYEASGILLNKPESGQEATIGLSGEMKFAAGGTIAAGAKISVTTSGWFVSAGSASGIVGECKLAVTSGSNGTGIFFFGSATKPQNFTTTVTAACNIPAGFAYALNDNKQADNGGEFSGVSIAAIASGYTGDIVVCGLVTITADPATAITAGVNIKAVTSGYFSPCDSGYFICGKSFSAIGSGATGQAFVIGASASEAL